MTREPTRFDDIAFYNGELYGLTSYKDVFRFEITNIYGATSVVVTHFVTIKQAPPAYIHYPSFDLENTINLNHLFVLGGKLAMARTWWHKTMTPLVDVCELTCDHERDTLNWTEVTSLGEHALFLGETCSTTVRVPAGGHGRVEGNCIYTNNALHLDNGGRMYHSQENERRIKVVNASQYGMWLIPPSL